jgi:hypothetical protein
MMNEGGREEEGQFGSGKGKEEKGVKQAKERREMDGGCHESAKRRIKRRKKIHAITHCFVLY